MGQAGIWTRFLGTIRVCLSSDISIGSAVLCSARVCTRHTTTRVACSKGPHLLTAGGAASKVKVHNTASASTIEPKYIHVGEEKKGGTSIVYFTSAQ